VLTASELTKPWKWPSIITLANYPNQNAPTDSADQTFFYVFDLLNLAGKNLMRLPLTERKEFLGQVITSASGPIRISSAIDAEPADLIDAISAQKLEGIVAKKRQSIYEPGKRSGAWVKFKLLQEAKFLVGGIHPTPTGFDSIVAGYFDGAVFRYAAKLEIYLRQQEQVECVKVLRQFKTKRCPFDDLPKRRPGDIWSVGLTSDEQQEFVWLQPVLQADVKFLERTSAGFLRHAQFVAFAHSTS